MSACIIYHFRITFSRYCLLAFDRNSEMASVSSEMNITAPFRQTAYLFLEAKSDRQTRVQYVSECFLKHWGGALIILRCMYSHRCLLLPAPLGFAN